MLVKKYEGKSLEEIKQLTESKDPYTAYLIGAGYSNRVAMKNGDKKKSPIPFFMDVKYLERSTVETDEIALKWFEIAAKGGIVDGMISLAHKILCENGLKTDSRLGTYWFSEALLRGAELEPISSDLFENTTLLIKEISACCESFRM